MASYTNAPYLQTFEMPVFQAPQEILTNVARQEQMRFDQGFAQQASQYQQMLNLPTTSLYATQKRDAYMRQAETTLRKNITADFSLPENQGLNNKVYKPMVKDPDILMDLSAGKNLDKEQQFGENLRTSPKEEDRAQYWNTMSNWIQTAKSELRNSTDAQSMHKWASEALNTKYVPYFNPGGFLDAEANKFVSSGGKMSIDAATGTGMIVTTVNGKQQEVPLYLWGQSILPEQAKDVFRVMGKVQTYQNLKALQSQGMSEGEARQHLAMDAINDHKGQLKYEYDLTNDFIEKQKAKREALKKAEGINDKNIGEFNQFDSMIEAASNKLHDLLTKRQQVDPSVNGFDKDKYNDMLQSYSLYPDQIYAENARNNAIHNWSVGRAGIDFQHKLTKDEAFFDTWKTRVDEVKAQTDYLKAQYELEKEKNKGTKGDGTTTSGASPNSDDNKPHFAGENTENPQSTKSYDYFQGVKHAAVDNTVNTSAALFGKAFQDEIDQSAANLGLKTNRFNDYLTWLSGNVKAGAATESPWGVHPQYSGVGKWDNEQKILADLNRRGILKNNDGTYSGILASMADASKDKVSTLRKNAVTPEERTNVSNLSTQLDYLEKGQAFLNQMSDDEKNIKSEILDKNRKFDPINDNGRRISLDEYLDRNDHKVYNFYDGNKPMQMTLAQAHQYNQAHPDAKLNAAIGTTAPSYTNPVGTTKYASAESLINRHKTNYDKINTDFENQFSNLVDIGHISTATRNPNGTVGFEYPWLQIDFKKDSTKVGKEEAELALNEAITPANIQRGADVVSNMQDLGSESDVKSVLFKIKGTLGKLDDTDGELLFSKAGKDGKNPTVKFIPSSSFINKLEGGTKDITFSKGEKDVLENIQKYGISINAPNTVISKQVNFAPAFTEMEIKKNGSADILPDLKNEGFWAQIKPGINGGPYELTLHYKTLDATTGQEVDKTTNRPLGDIKGNDLDAISQTATNSVLQNYYAYTDMKSANNKSKPTKYYSEDELKALRSNQ